MIIYYDSKTGNVRKFVEKLVALKPNWTAVNIQDGFKGGGHLITYTVANGSPPATSVAFLKMHGKAIRSVSVSGNRNWGLRFAQAAKIINRTFGIPILLKFEISGFQNDLEFFIENVIKYEKDNNKIRKI